jgi:hypothetical protein
MHTYVRLCNVLRVYVSFKWYFGLRLRLRLGLFERVHDRDLCGYGYGYLREFMIWSLWLRLQLFGGLLWSLRSKIVLNENNFLIGAKTCAHVTMASCKTWTVYLCVYVCVCVYIYIYIYIYIVCIYIYVCVCVCIRVHDQSRLQNIWLRATNCVLTVQECRASAVLLSAALVSCYICIHAIHIYTYDLASCHEVVSVLPGK